LARRLGGALPGRRVLLIGLAYKRIIDALRETPSPTLIDLLEARGAVADYHDPLIPRIPPAREHARLAGRASTALVPATIGAYDVVLIATDHDGIDYAALAGNAKLVIDTRNVCERNGLVAANIVKA